MPVAVLVDTARVRLANRLPPVNTATSATITPAPDGDRRARDLVEQGVVQQGGIRSSSRSGESLPTASTRPVAMPAHSTNIRTASAIPVRISVAR